LYIKTTWILAFLRLAHHLLELTTHFMNPGQPKTASALSLGLESCQPYPGVLLWCKNISYSLWQSRDFLSYKGVLSFFQYSKDAGN